MGFLGTPPDIRIHATARVEAVGLPLVLPVLLVRVLVPAHMHQVNHLKHLGAIAHGHLPHIHLALRLQDIDAEAVRKGLHAARLGIHELLTQGVRELVGPALAADMEGGRRVVVLGGLHGAVQLLARAVLLEAHVALAPCLDGPLLGHPHHVAAELNEGLEAGRLLCGLALLGNQTGLLGGRHVCLELLIPGLGQVPPGLAREVALCQLQDVGGMEGVLAGAVADMEVVRLGQVRGLVQQHPGLGARGGGGPPTRPAPILHRQSGAAAVAG